jgi:hypothetical protein
MSRTVAAAVPLWRRYRSTMASEPTSSSNVPLAEGICDAASVGGLGQFRQDATLAVSNRCGELRAAEVRCKTIVSFACH